MKRIAVYPGTFDPITNGHIDILKKSVKLFDKIIISVANVTGKNTLFSLKERKELCKTAVAEIENVEVKSYDGLSVDFCNEVNAITMIRGLRAVSDFEYELQLALMNKKLEKNLDTIFLVPDNEFLYLSSSMVKQLAKLGGNISDFVPECCRIHLEKKIGKGE